MWKLVGRAMVFVVLPALLIGLCGWGVTGWYGISRDRVVVDRIWIRMENAYMHRMDLVPDFLATAHGARLVDSALLDEFHEMRKRITDFPSTDAILSDTDEYRKFSEAQDRLSECTTRILNSLEERGGTRANEDLDVLRGQLDITHERLETEQVAFARAVKAYNDSLERLPGRIVASLFGLEPVLQGLAYDPLWERAGWSSASGGENL